MSDISVMQADWEIIEEKKDRYVSVYQVGRIVNGEKEVAFFKFTTPTKQKKYIGPLAANEWIANRLGTLLQIPVAKTEFAVIDGHLGVVSYQHPSPYIKSWNKFNKEMSTEIEQMIVNWKRLFKTFVFDAWICNIDRNGENILVYPEEEKFNFYLIDHELCLLGAIRFENKSWDSKYWLNIRRYTRGYEPALLKFIKEYQELKPFVDEIWSICPTTISAVIDSCPEEILSSEEKETMMEFLLYRQRKLDSIIRKSMCNI